MLGVREWHRKIFRSTGKITSEKWHWEQKNVPIVQHHGDVTTANFKDYIGYDLLIGGSPCQSLANCNMYLKDGEYGVNGTGTSRLFWEYVRALKTIKPKWFFFENVASMKNADKDIITEQLGVKPVKINSVLFSAQVRNRLYWTNIPFATPPHSAFNRCWTKRHIRR